jgi:hypothetical protein
VKVPHPGTGTRAGKGAASATTIALRSWNVMPGPGLDEYQVTDYGAKGIEAVHNGVAVWCGKRTKGGYETTRTTITSPEQLAKLLTCIAAGDEGLKEAESSPAQAAQAPRRRARSAKPKEGPSEAVATGKPSAASGNKRGPRAPAKIATAKGEPAAPRRSRRAEPAPPTQRATPAASPAKPSGKGRGGGRRKPAAAPTPTSGERVTIQLPDDETVLAGVRAKVEKKQKDPAKAEHLFGTLKRIWLAGGREKTIAWMQTHGVNNAVDAFDAWVKAHTPEAMAMVG